MFLDIHIHYQFLYKVHTYYFFFQQLSSYFYPAKERNLHIPLYENDFHDLQLVFYQLNKLHTNLFYTLNI